jgi:hypothetical protein
MSGVRLAESRLNVAKPVAAQSAAPYLLSEPAPLDCPADIFIDPPELVPVDPRSRRHDPESRRHRLGRVFATQGLAAMMVCGVHVITHEAPAWALSMVVHMVTLVTMAMVGVPGSTPFQAQNVTITPPEQRAVEEVMEIVDRQPETLDEEDPPDAAIIESKIAQDNVMLDPGDEPQNLPPASDASLLGLDCVPKGDMMTLVRASGNAYADRGIAGNIEEIEKEGGNKVTERCVANALKWLAIHQMPDGGWNFDLGPCPSCHGQCRDSGKLGEARNAATALALLPFLGSGYTHKDTKQYRATVNNGLQFLLKRMHNTPQGGSLFEPGGQMYSHGIGSIAICEAFAMTGDRDLRLPARAALSFIVSAQDPKGGGWRYTPREAGDTSMVGWQLMALKSGQMSNLGVPSRVGRKVSAFLDSVQSDGGALYGYQVMDQGSDATVAIGLLSRMYLGWKRDNAALQRGVQWLSRRGPSASNMYYNYYATQVMRHWEGDLWKNWNQQMRDQLIHSQARQGHEEGSWFTGGGDLGAPTGGRLYCTAMAAMILEVYYRNLPIYRMRSVEQDFPD